MPLLHQLSSAQLRQALELREQIDLMQGKLAAILGGSEADAPAPVAKAKGTRRGRGAKRTMSEEGRAKIAAAARARWAKLRSGADKAAKSATAPAAKLKQAKPLAPKSLAAAKKIVTAPKKRAGLTDEGRERLSAAMKARWVARKKAAGA